MATITMVGDEARTDRRSSRSTVTPTKIEEDRGQRIGKNWQKRPLDSRPIQVTRIVEISMEVLGWHKEEQKWSRGKKNKNRKMPSECSGSRKKSNRDANRR